MIFIDAFIAAVPTANKESYCDHAEKAGAAFRKYGALRVVECWGEDVPDGKVTSFPMAVKRSANETVVVGWIEWPDRATRDAGMAKVMVDPSMNSESNPMPFDGMRMIYGGFQSILDL